MARSTALIAFRPTCPLLERALLLRLGLQIRCNFVSGEKGPPLWPRTVNRKIGDPSQSRLVKNMELTILLGKLCCAFGGERREKSRGNEPGSLLGD